jgi:tetratricopeptide (TPR) repeat protein
LHTRIVQAIERLYPDRLAEHVERLAHHAFRGELWDKAVLFLRQAGNRAAARNASPEAVAWLEQALVALGHLPESREVIEQAVDVRFDLQGPLTSLAAVGRILDYLRDAHALAGRLDDQRRLGRVAAHMTFCFWFTGQPDQAVVSGLRALAIASALDDRALEVLTNYRLGQTYVTLGEYSRGMERCARNAALLQGELVSERFGMPALPAVTARTMMATCFGFRGDFAAAAAAAEDAGRVAELVNHAFSRAWGHYAIGQTHLAQGNVDDALPWLERSFDFYRRGNFPFVRPVVAAALGEAYALAGRVTDGVVLIHQAVEESASVNLVVFHPRILGGLAEAYLLAGRQHEALPAVERALDLTRTHKQRGFEAEALRTLGDIHSACDQFDAEKVPHERSGVEKVPHGGSGVEKAETSYRAAIALATELDMRPLIARSYLGLGRLYRRAGRREEAEQALTTAVTMFREMDMRFWLTQAEAELKGSSDLKSYGTVRRES